MSCNACEILFQAELARRMAAEQTVLADMLAGSSTDYQMVMSTAIHPTWHGTTTMPVPPFGTADAVIPGGSRWDLLEVLGVDGHELEQVGAPLYAVARLVDQDGADWEVVDIQRVAVLAPVDVTTFSEGRRRYLQGAGSRIRLRARVSDVALQQRSRAWSRTAPGVVETLSLEDDLGEWHVTARLRVLTGGVTSEPCTRTYVGDFDVALEGAIEVHRRTAVVAPTVRRGMRLG